MAIGQEDNVGGKETIRHAWQAWQAWAGITTMRYLIVQQSHLGSSKVLVVLQVVAT